MLARRSCHDCGRQVRLSTTIEPPRCPACRLASLPPLVETRPCLGCSVPIPVNSHDLHCGHCRTRPSPPPVLNNRPCYDCGTPFPARTRIIRCFYCRSRRSTAMQAPVDYDRLRTTTFNPFVNTFQCPHNTGESVIETTAPPMPLPTLQQSLLSQPSLPAIKKRRHSTLLRPVVKKQRTLDVGTFRQFNNFRHLGNRGQFRANLVFVCMTCTVAVHARFSTLRHHRMLILRGVADGYLRGAVSFVALK